MKMTQEEMTSHGVRSIGNGAIVGQAGGSYNSPNFVMDSMASGIWPEKSLLLIRKSLISVNCPTWLGSVPEKKLPSSRRAVRLATLNNWLGIVSNRKLSFRYNPSRGMSPSSLGNIPVKALLLNMMVWRSRASPISVGRGPKIALFPAQSSSKLRKDPILVVTWPASSLLLIL